MRAIKWIVFGFSALVVILCIVAKLQTLGGQGIFTLAMAALPAVLVIGSQLLGWSFGRLFAGLSLVGFLIVGMKTSQGDEFSNIMMAAFAGMLVSLVNLIKPEKVSAARIARPV